MGAWVRRQRGISLIEVLIGMAIGAIGVVIIFQTVIVWSRHNQSTAAGGDAQAGGTLALFAIERDLKQAGHGFGTAPLPIMGCTVNAYDTSGSRTPPGFHLSTLRPIDIIPGAGGDPDQIKVLYGNSSFFVESMDFLSSLPTSKTLRRRGGFRLGDLILVADAGAGAAGTANCSLAEVTSDANPDFLTIDHAQANYASYYKGAVVPSQFDPAAGPAFPYIAGTIYNLGPQPQLASWQVVNSRALQRGELIFNVLPADNQVADGVINLKAEYGVDVNGNTRIEPGEWFSTLPVGTTWSQVYAVRVALLVRSRQFERSADAGSTASVPVTTNKPTYFGSELELPKEFTMKNVNGVADTFSGSPTTPDPLNWRYYRYRVYERVIPLKNMLWPLP